MTAPPRHPGELRWETRLLAVVAATLVTFGLAVSYGASPVIGPGGESLGLDFELKQLSGALLGGLLMLAIARTDYAVLQRLAWPMLLVAIALLVVPLLPFTTAIAPRINGARRWIDVGPLNLQPSEAAKFALVVWCAMLAAKKGTQVRAFKTGVVPFLVMIGLVCLLIFLEPNASTAVLVGLVAGAVVFSAGARIGHFLLLGGLAALVLLPQLDDAAYRVERILAFQDPEATRRGAGLQLYESLVGFGSGGFFGRGFGEGQAKFGFLPYAYSDFLFSVIGEEWGFVGVCFTVFLFGLFCWLGFRIAKTAADPFGQFLAAGITAMVGLTALIHMFVNVGLMPTTGQVLPFMSAGRSSLVIMLSATGVLLSVGRQRGRPRPARGAAGDA